MTSGFKKTRRVSSKRAISINGRLTPDRNSDLCAHAVSVNEHEAQLYYVHELKSLDPIIPIYDKELGHHYKVRPSSTLPDDHVELTGCCLECESHDDALRYKEEIDKNTETEIKCVYYGIKIDK